MNPIHKELSSISPIHLHYAIGANCYQHVRGFNKAIIGIVPAPEKYADTVQRLHYLSLLPGNAGAVFDEINSFTEASVKKTILDGCKEDKIVVLDGALETISDMTPAAVFFSKENTRDGLPADFHFVVRKENGEWEDKVPLRDVQTYQGLPQQIDGYQFSNFILVPKSLPQGIRKLSPIFKTIADSNVSAEVALVDYRKVERGNVVFAKRQDGRAMINNPNQKFEIPAPAYIPQA